MAVWGCPPSLWSGCNCGTSLVGSSSSGSLLSSWVWKDVNRLGTRDWNLMPYSSLVITGGQKHTHTHTHTPPIPLNLSSCAKLRTLRPSSTTTTSSSTTSASLSSPRARQMTPSSQICPILRQAKCGRASFAFLLRMALFGICLKTRAISLMAMGLRCWWRSFSTAVQILWLMHLHPSSLCSTMSKEWWANSTILVLFWRDHHGPVLVQGCYSPDLVGYALPVGPSWPLLWFTGTVLHPLQIDWACYHWYYCWWCYVSQRIHCPQAQGSPAFYICSLYAGCH